MEQSLHRLNPNLEKLENRFACGEIDGDIFEKVGVELKREIKSVNNALAESGNELSNPALMIHHSPKSFQISLISGFPETITTSANFRNCCFREEFCLISNSTIIEP
jgi:hypothetical protein